MTDIKTGRNLKVMLLDIGRLPRKAIHEIDADIGNAGFTAGLDCGDCLGSGVTSAKKTEQVIVEGLDSHADAIDTNSSKGRYVRGGYVIGIALYSEFLQVLKSIRRADTVNHLPYLFRTQARGSTSTEVDSRNRIVFEIILSLTEFSAKGIYITCGFILTHGGEEAAVYTASGTKRNMDVYARHMIAIVRSWS